jgi:NitT/TauT family transport system substrate-binding protein
VRTHRRALLAGVGAVAVTALAACGRRQAPTDETGRVRLRFATDWTARAEHGGFYQALASGAYARRGLNVEIVQGRPNVDVPGLLASGAVELGLGSDSFTAMRLVAEGAPVRAVAAFFQKDPQVLLAHPDPAVEDIGDLAGRSFHMTPAARLGPWAWLKARYGFVDEQLRDYVPLPAGYAADPQGVHLTSGLTGVQALAGADVPPPTVLDLAAENYGSYAALVLAPTGFARDNAQALRGFIAASAEGWRDYLQGDGRAADALIRRADPSMSQALLDRSRAALRAGGYVDGGDAALYGLGTMTTERWQAFFQTVVPAGLFPDNLDWRAVFTNQYLPGRG